MYAKFQEILLNILEEILDFIKICKSFDVTRSIICISHKSKYHKNDMKYERDLNYNLGGWVGGKIDR